MRLSLRVMVVSVEEKQGVTLQVKIRKTNETELPLTRRKPQVTLKLEAGLSSKI
jgi:hypothetical protein